MNGKSGARGAASVSTLRWARKKPRYDHVTEQTAFKAQQQFDGHGDYVFRATRRIEPNDPLAFLCRGNVWYARRDLGRAMTDWGWDGPLDRQAKEALARQEPGVFWAAHQCDLPYSQIERLVNLGALPPTGFKVACFPLKIQGGVPARHVSWPSCPTDRVVLPPAQNQTSRLPTRTGW